MEKMEIFGQSLSRLRAFLDLEYKGLNISPIVSKSQELDEIFIKDFLEISKWLSEHLEVKFLNINLHLQETFIPKFENETDYLSYREKCRTLFNTLLQLPQIIIIDFQGHFENIWCEFLYHANFSLSDVTSTFNFNHLKKGILPVSPIIKNLDQQNKNILLTGQKLEASELANKIIHNRIYSSSDERRKIITTIKKNIFESSPTSIIQLKHAFSATTIEDYEKIIHYTYINEDWKNNNKFKSIHELKNILAKVEQITTSENQIN